MLTTYHEYQYDGTYPSTMCFLGTFPFKASDLINWNEQIMWIYVILSLFGISGL